MNFYRTEPPFISVKDKIHTRWGKASASFLLFFLWCVLVYRVVATGEDSYGGIILRAWLVEMEEVATVPL